MPRTEWVVGANDAGARLDKFLAAAARLGSRGRASAAIIRGKVFVNGAEATPDAAGVALAAGDRIAVWMDRPGSARRRLGRSAAADELQIVYRDEALVVVNKPAGLLAVPLPQRDAAPSVADALAHHLRFRGRQRPLVVHRIDRDTSGLVLFALQRHAQAHLKEQFLRHEPERIYLAVVYGHPDPPSGRWHDMLVWDERAMIQKETHPRDPRGKEATCDYRIVERFRDTSLIEVALVTGKRNQIRLQARLRGHMLVGEQRYVFGPEHLRSVPFGRQALHAHRLSFRHPETERALRFEAPPPEDFDELVARLRNA